MIITIQQCRGPAFCITGARNFFKHHGLDFDDFKRNGIDSEYLLKKCNNDAQAVKIIEWCKGNITNKRANKKR